MKRILIRLGGLMLTLLAFAWHGRAQDKPVTAITHQHRNHDDHDGHDHDHEGEHNHGKHAIDPATIPGLPAVADMTPEQKDRWELHQHFESEWGADRGGYWKLKERVADRFRSKLMDGDFAEFNVHLFPSFYVDSKGQITNVSVDGKHESLAAQLSAALQQLNPAEVLDLLDGANELTIDFQVHAKTIGSDQLQVRWYF